MKKYISLIVVMLLVVSLMGTSVNAQSTNGSDNKISVLTLTNQEYCIDSDSVGYTKQGVDMFSGKSIVELSSYDVIQLSIADMKSLMSTRKSEIMQLVNNGAILYVQDSELKEEELAKMLSIPYEGNSHEVYSGVKLGIALMRVNNNYIFENQYCVEATPTGKSQEFANVMSGSASIVKNIINIRKELYKSINEVNNNYVDENQLSLQSLPSGYTYYNNGNQNVVDNDRNVIGWRHITQYIFVRNTQTEGGHTYKIFDTTTRFTAGANDGYYVKKYTGRIHSNINDHQVIDHTYLNSDTQTSQSLELSGGFSGDGVSIGGGSSTSWSWTPDSQNITNYFPTAKYREWRVTTAANRYANSWVIEPGIRSVNTRAESHTSGAFSSNRLLQLKNALITYQYDTVFEVGRWF